MGIRRKVVFEAASRWPRALENLLPRLVEPRKAIGSSKNMTVGVNPPPQAITQNLFSLFIPLEMWPPSSPCPPHM